MAFYGDGAHCCQQPAGHTSPVVACDLQKKQQLASLLNYRYPIRFQEIGEEDEFPQRFSQFLFPLSGNQGYESNQKWFSLLQTVSQSSQAVNHPSYNLLHNNIPITHLWWLDVGILRQSLDLMLKYKPVIHPYDNWLWFNWTLSQSMDLPIRQSSATALGPQVEDTYTVTFLVDILWCKCIVSF